MHQRELGARGMVSCRGKEVLLEESSRGGGYLSFCKDLIESPLDMVYGMRKSQMRIHQDCIVKTC